jgi:hypothetical protein
MADIMDGIKAKVTQVRLTVKELREPAAAYRKMAAEVAKHARQLAAAADAKDTAKLNAAQAAMQGRRGGGSRRDEINHFCQGCAARNGGGGEGVLRALKARVSQSASSGGTNAVRSREGMWQPGGLGGALAAPAGGWERTFHAGPTERRRCGQAQARGTEAWFAPPSGSCRDGMRMLRGTRQRCRELLGIRGDCLIEAGHVHGDLDHVAHVSSIVAPKTCRVLVRLLYRATQLPRSRASAYRPADDVDEHAVAPLRRMSSSRAR